MATPTGKQSVQVASLKPGQLWHDNLADGTPGPTLVVVPGGSYWMGTAATGELEAGQAESEQPLHQVTLAKAFAVAQTETTVGEFRRFIEASGYEIPPGCWYHSPEQEWLLDESASWEAPGYAQSEAHPANCLNWADAKAYTAWLSEQTGALYRLASEAEFEYFNRAQIQHAPVGEHGSDALAPGESVLVSLLVAQLCEVANGAGRETGLPYANHCDDGYVHASPVRKFKANAFGLYDTRGNLWELTEDCWNADYAGSWRTLFSSAPVDGSAWTRGDCRLHSIRGGSFLSSPANLRVARREPDGGRLRLNRTGMRLVREL